jgi:hypothetical protein
MDSKKIKRYFALLAFIFTGLISFGQNVPLGIFYQAVARDNYGREIANEDIDVKFSIISGNPLGTVVYQELHSEVITSKYGVFSLIIGHGTPTGGIYGELSQVTWSQAFHYLKIEVKFENDFIDMGTMQFLAVPYALYAQKSLEPGPAGPKGDPGPKGEAGDPASDDQALSVINVDGSDYLAISGGNQVKISSIEKDGDPTNEIQDLIISSDKLKITRNPLATEWDLTRYLDNTDSQTLTWNAGTRILGISGNAGTINLSELKNDADADPTNEIQSLTYNQSSHNLSISGGNNVVLGDMIAFRAKKAIPTSAPLPLSNVDFIPDEIEYNDGLNFDPGTGEFSAPSTGIYTFDIKYIAPTASVDGIKIMIYKNGNLYEYLGTGISSGTTLFRTLTIKLIANNKIKFVIHTGTGVEIGTGTFSGFRVY